MSLLMPERRNRSPLWAGHGNRNERGLRQRRRRGGTSVYKSIRSPYAFHSPRSTLSSPSATVQWAELAASALWRSLVLSLRAAVSGSPSSVGLGSAEQGDGGLDSGSGMDLVR